MRYNLFAILFGMIAIATSTVLILDTPKNIDQIFALFWFITGLLGFYIGRRITPTQNLKKWR